ncbi:PREDICTED: uncharacterized protein LOC109157069 [Ipomoea nil]|uniref:uncharacterized protein LOC109157069 n=1 Tax=Ipomoea nil TaxID=35883 RepID=UPI0009008EBE|nr:PREDICTED: uncharacterized protein LOC109157069 [Ipomoea nil]
MGNCSLKAIDDATKDLGFARIITDSGQLLHLRAPKSVRQLLSEFPGYNVYGQGHMSAPMSEQDHLLDGQFYYLLPVAGETEEAAPENEVRRVSGLEVLPPPRKGVWKVKFVIDSQQLGEILAEDENTEAMIEQMRSAAISSQSPKGRRRSLKVIFTNAFKLPLENQSKVQAMDSCSSSPR